MSAAVIALPTAAPKKVRQRLSQTRKADRDALLRFPALPTATERRRAERMELAMEADLPSLFRVVQALALTMEKPQQREAFMALLAGSDRTGGREAVAWWQIFVSDPYTVFSEGR